ncbi:MAG: IS1182 family transposase [Nitrococcus sp.]|nr:IS1182 family transposase [Nitrococcus sp.]
MLGPAKPRHLDEPIAVSLEALVPADHFYRHLEATLDLGFVRDWVQDRYAERGRPSIDPVVFCKLHLIMFFEGIRSERKLIETASLHLAHRWYLGYALDEALPEHSSLTRIRQRLGVAFFQRFFEAIVDRCQAAGLVWGQELYFDATKVEANANVASLVPRFAYAARTHLATLFADEPGADPPSDSPEDAPPAAGPAAEPRPPGIVALPGADTVPAAERPWPLLEARRLDPQRPAHHSRRRTRDYRVSPTDPDATPLWDWGAIRLGYHDHYVVDGGKARIILAALVTPADVMENQAMLDLLWRVCFRRQLWPHHVTGDAKYGTTENIVAVEDAGIRAYVPLPAAPRTAWFGRADFTFEPVADQYRCPAGQPLPRRGVKPSAEVIIYRADPALCNGCSRKAECTTSDHGRMVHRSRFAGYLERVQGYHATEAYQKALRKRQVWVEPLFAEAQQWHGLDRLRLRGLRNANIQGLLVAAGQNLKRLLVATGWGRRHAPCGSLVALPGPSARLAVGSG